MGLSNWEMMAAVLGGALTEDLTRIFPDPPLPLAILWGNQL
jgi:hypothetical protein